MNKNTSIFLVTSIRGIIFTALKSILFLSFYFFLFSCKDATPYPIEIISSDGKILFKYDSYQEYVRRKDSLNPREYIARAVFDELKKENILTLKKGTKVYITIDSRMQLYAEQAVKEHMSYLQQAFFDQVQGSKTAPFSGVSMEMSNNLFKIAMCRTGRYKQLKEQGLSEEKIIEEFKKPILTKIITWKGYKDTLMSPWDSIRYHKHIAKCALLSMESQTGYIKAWVGGIDWNYFPYDHVKQARRQAGSIFKPFVYASLIANNGYTPCTMVSYVSPNEMGWKPKNSVGGRTLKDVFTYSGTGYSTTISKLSGVKNTIALCRELGIESPISTNSTFLLGSSDITLYEMVGAYATFSNTGNYIKPQLLLKIEEEDGTVIKEFKPKSREVLSPMNAYYMIDMLENSVQKGTARSAKTYTNTWEIAGKTGTTNKNSDAWFIGMTPELTTGVWVGWEDRYTHFNSGLGGIGAKSALPVWGIYMRKIEKDKNLALTYSKAKFTLPQNTKKIICDSIKSYYGGYGESYGTIDDFK